MAIIISDEAREILSRNKSLLKKNNLKEFYARVPEKLRSEITEFFISVSGNGFDFQKYLEVIPTAFLAENKNVKQFAVGNNITMIDKFAFKNSALESINLNNVEIIKDYAFEGCNKLREVYLPETVRMIGKGVWPDNVILKSGPRKRNSLRFPKSELEWYKNHLILVKPESNEEE